MTVAACPEWTWLVVVGAFAAFAFGWATGSNDVANAFGTSVGAKTLKLWHAVVLAALFEFAGALVLGRVSTGVIAGSIAKIEYFYAEPEIYAYGMVIALSVGFFWQTFASYIEMNVSATHSIIGAIIGFALVYGGGDAVNWALPDPASFPPYKGVLPIVLAWFFSPVLTAIASAILFFLLRFMVLRRKNAYFLSFWVLPFAVMLTCWVCIYFVFTKGAKKQFSQDKEDWDDNKAAWVAACVAGGMGFLTVVVALPILKFRADKAMERQADEEAVKAEKAASAAANNDAGSDDVAPSTLSGKMSRSMKQAWKAATYGMTVDIHATIGDDPIVAAMHERAEVFDPKAEYAFSYLQVFSAICVIFSHGAGEVGYMAGPLSTVYDVYLTGTLNKNTTAKIWIILIGALGLVIGLATYGYKVTRAMGVRMAKLSPSRGFCAELSTAMIIMIASQYGLPTSSSQCITGGIIGVGMLEGGGKGVNWKFFAETFAMWIGTIIVVGFSTAAVFAQGVYAPSITLGNQVMVYETQVSAMATGIFSNVQSQLTKLKAASTANNLPNSLTLTRFNALNATLVANLAKIKSMTTIKSYGTIKPGDLVNLMGQALSLLQQTTISTVGQEQLVAGKSTLPVCNNASYTPGNGLLLPAAGCPVTAAFTAGLKAPYNLTAAFKFPPLVPPPA